METGIFSSYKLDMIIRSIRWLVFDSQTLWQPKGIRYITPHEILDIEYVTLLCILGEAFIFHLPLLEVDAYRKLDEPDILTAIQDLKAAFQVQMRLIAS